MKHWGSWGQGTLYSWEQLRFVGTGNIGILGSKYIWEKGIIGVLRKGKHEAVRNRECWGDWEHNHWWFLGTEYVLLKTFYWNISINSFATGNFEDCKTLFWSN